ncbi:CU044_2847 family protein [Nonomuraea sp. NPDC048892]|uniref:CU044_2847 family protein n=1 Tax=Nonomuraea sp. NPDC048892 TaxID=3154624 RepID=UPI003408C43B
MAGEQKLAVKIGGGDTMVVVAEPVGGTLVADKDLVTELSEITTSVERVSREVLQAVRRAGPTKGTIELGFSLAVESGHVVAMLGKGRGEATIRVTLEWAAADMKEARDAAVGRDR